MEGSYINKSGLVSTDFDVVSLTKKKTETDEGENSKTREKTKSHTVAAGEMISTIAKQYGISAEAILWANDLDQTDTLRIGQVLRIPPVS
jgi:LysM repeat protein